MINIPDEEQFINQYLESLSSRSVRFGEDYNPRVLPSPLRINQRPAAPQKKTVTARSAPATTTTTTTTTTEAQAPSEEEQKTLELIIKVLKPAAQFSLGHVLPTDTVATLKQHIYQIQPSYPPYRQRLLLKGKALADQKTLKDYAISNGSLIHLMLTAAAKPTEAPASSSTTTTSTITPADVPVTATGRFGLSAAAEKELEQTAFWENIEKTVSGTLNKEDTTIVINKFKQALFP
ncbi:hypothetical protein EC973_000057 [Apophysomyces ossiformis]|uniref:Ubiquitin-like domain-containing protein n=1 Tax=Apophysomyces ossiformis TaxID=679940 RepID=A0A8H7C0X9_9FUNG|nr:hypothetical protein EC973_000057 [Apophysomyces ossiformis]